MMVVVAQIVWVGLASGMWRRRRRSRSGGLARKKRSTKNEKRKVKEKNTGKSKAIGAIHSRGGVYILKGTTHRHAVPSIYDSFRCASLPVGGRGIVARKWIERRRNMFRLNIIKHRTTDKFPILGQSKCTSSSPSRSPMSSRAPSGV